MLLLVLAAIGCLRDVARAGDVVVISEFFRTAFAARRWPWRFLAVDRLFSADLHVSHVEREAWFGGNLLALRRDLRGGICIY